MLAAADADWADVVRAEQVDADDWRALARRGGYPTPALDLETVDERATWFAGYVRTYLERDLQEISSVTALPDLRRLMRAACLRIGQLINQTELYWRTAAGAEVDFVLEVDRKVIPIEIKATSRPRVDDGRHLQSFREEYKGRSRPGLLLHTGDRVEWLAPGILAAPWWRVI